ncbi:MAG: DUF4157 domain-containing protein [Actinomycetota bacterium]
MGLGQRQTGQQHRSVDSEAPSSTRPAAPDAFAHVKDLQRNAGNRATQNLLQPKLSVGAADDVYEREADQVASEVMSDIQRMDEEELMAKRVEDVQRVEDEELMMKPAVQRIEDEELMAKRVEGVQRVEGIQRMDEEELMMKPAVQRDAIGLEGGELDAETDQQIEQARGGGRELDGGLRRKMEGSFGVDFSGVRVHDNAGANDLNEKIQARAFTTGSDIFFRSGEYDPSSSGGQELLAHELTHVVQQGGAG